MKDCKQIQEKLTSYALGDLSPAEEDSVRLHVTECEGCRAALLEIEPTLELIRNALAARPVVPRLEDARRIEVMKTVRSGRLTPVSFQRIAAMAAILLIGVFVGAMAMFFMLKNNGMVAGRSVKGDIAYSMGRLEADSKAGSSSILVVASTPRPLPLYDHPESGEEKEAKVGASIVEKKVEGTGGRLAMKPLSATDEVKARAEISPRTFAPAEDKPEKNAVVLKLEKAEADVAAAGVKQDADEARAVQAKLLEPEGGDKRIESDQARSKADVAGLPSSVPAATAPDTRSRKDPVREVASIPAPKPKPLPAPAVARPEPVKPARIPVAIVRGQYKGGDWNVNPRAVNALAGLAGSVTGMALNADFQVKIMDMASADLTETKPLFVFLSGTKNFSFSNHELARLREYLSGGGCVWADAGRPGRQTVFEVAFRREIKRVVPAIEFKPAPAGHAMFDRLHKGVGLAAGVGGAKTPVEIGWLNGRPAVLLTVNGYGALWNGDEKVNGGLARDAAGKPASVATNEAGNVHDPVAMDAGRFGVNTIVYLMLVNSDAFRAVPFECRPTGGQSSWTDGAVTNRPPAGARN